jgi:hypothetical protein
MSKNAVANYTSILIVYLSGAISYFGLVRDLLFHLISYYKIRFTYAGGTQDGRLVVPNTADAQNLTTFDYHF